MTNPIVVICRTVLFILAAGIWAAAVAEERGIFDYDGQRKAGDDVVKIVFIGDAGTHGPRGNHEFVAGSILLARDLHAAYPQVHAVVHSSNNWPADLSYTLSALEFATLRRNRTRTYWP